MSHSINSYSAIFIIESKNNKSRYIYILLHYAPTKNCPDQHIRCGMKTMETTSRLDGENVVVSENKN